MAVSQTPFIKKLDKVSFSTEETSASYSNEENVTVLSPPSPPPIDPDPPEGQEDEDEKKKGRKERGKKNWFCNPCHCFTCCGTDRLRGGCITIAIAGLSMWIVFLILFFITKSWTTLQTDTAPDSTSDKWAGTSTVSVILYVIYAFSFVMSLASSVCLLIGACRRRKVLAGVYVGLRGTMVLLDVTTMTLSTIQQIHSPLKEPIKIKNRDEVLIMSWLFFAFLTCINLYFIVCAFAFFRRQKVEEYDEFD